MTNKTYVFAVYIYFVVGDQPNKDGYQLMADLIIGHNERKTIHWDKPAEREKYCFDAYTLYYDTRPKPQWDKWLNNI